MENILQKNTFVCLDFGEILMANPEKALSLQRDFLAGA